MPTPARLGLYTVLEPSDRPLVLGRSLLAPAELVVLQALPGPAHEEPFASVWLDEMRLLTRLALPGVVPVRDVFVASTGPGQRCFCLAHGYLPSWPLDGLLAAARRRREPVPLAVASAVALGVLDALAGVHAAATADRQPLGLLHRALAPSRVLVDVDGAVWLWDVPGARGACADDGRAPGLLRDVLAYLPPESARGEPLVVASDLHRVGSLLWELLAGRPRLEAPDALGMLSKLLYGAPPAPSRARPDVPPPLDAITLRALARSPRERPADARSFASELSSAQAPAPRAGVAAWASALGAEPWPGPEAYRLVATTRGADEPVEAAGGRTPYR